MKTKTSKKVQVEKVLIYDIDVKEFRFFKDFFETYLTEDLIENEKNEQIKSIIVEKLPFEYQKNWVIVFGRDLAYNMQAKKKHLLIFKLGKIAFFVFQGKYLDMPGAEPVEYFDEVKYDTDRLEDFTENRVQILEQKALKTEDFAKNVQKWIGKFCLKYEEKMYENYADFERLLVKKLKVELMLRGKEGFWNIFIGPRVTYTTENVKMETEMSFTLDLTGGRINKGKKNIVIFQKKGDVDPYMEFLVKRKKEMVGFVGMLFMFLILVTCRDFTYPVDEQINHVEVLSVLSFKYREQEPYKDLVCMNQQVFTLIAGAIFFLYIGAKIYGSVQKKRKVKKFKLF